MTTIACNKEVMAGDLQFTEHDLKKWKGRTKIFKMPSHPNVYPESEYIIGFAGGASSIIEVVEYLMMPDIIKPPRIRGRLQGLVLTKKGDIFTFDDYTKWLFVNEKYAAIGSGSMAALGAMASGADPKTAVKAAAKHDIYTGMGYNQLSFN